jgi:hypothetical protein
MASRKGADKNSARIVSLYTVNTILLRVLCEYFRLRSCMVPGPEADGDATAFLPVAFLGPILTDQAHKLQTESNAQ